MNVWHLSACVECGTRTVTIGRTPAVARCEACLVGSIAGITPATRLILARAFNSGRAQAAS